MRYLLALLLLSVTSGAIPSAQAASGAISPSLSVSPGIVKEIFKPGEQRSIQLRLENLGSDPIPLSATLVNIARVSEAGAPELTSELTPQSASSWLAADKPEFILAPGQKQEVSVTITVPPDAAPGGYSAAMIFQAKLPSYYFDIDANARILPALSVSFLVTVSTGTVPSIDSLTINSFQVPLVVLSTPIPVVTEINNPTNFFIYANGAITVKSAYGQNSEVSQLKSSVLMPDANRQYITAYTGSMWPGVYRAEVRLNDGGQTLIASARFVVIPWQFLLIILVFLIIIFIIRGRRRLKSALSALSGKEPPTTRPRPIIR